MTLIMPLVLLLILYQKSPVAFLPSISLSLLDRILSKTTVDIHTCMHASSPQTHISPLYLVNVLL